MSNTKLNLNGVQLQLLNEIGSGNFATVYKTSLSNYVAKVAYKSNPKAFEAFKNEQALLQKIKSDGIVDFKVSGEAIVKNQTACILVIEYCPGGSLIEILEKNNPPNEQLVMQAVRDVTQGLVAIHQGGFIHRDVKMENVLLNNQGKFKLCDFGSVSSRKILKFEDNSMRSQTIEEMEENTTPMYRAPEIIDTYLNFPITEKLDIFALGVLIFIFCFQKPPFESGLAAVNNHYFIPENHQYSPSLVNLMKQLITPNPVNRPTAQEVLEIIDKNWTLPSNYNQSQPPSQIQQMPNLNNRFNSVDNIYIEQQEMPLGMFDRLKRYLYQLSKRTEAWVVQTTEDNDQPPRAEDIKSLIIKAWFKKDKIPKFYLAAKEKIVLQQMNKPRVVMKFLIVLHNYLKKGPTEVLDCSTPPTGYWILQQIMTSFPKGTSIHAYSQLLIKKINLCTRNRRTFEGNYSLSPFFSMLQSGQPLTPISFDLLDQLLLQWQECNDSLQFIKPSPINICAILSIVDEAYSILSLFIHLYHAIKQSTNFIDIPLNAELLTERILTIEDKFERQFTNSKNLFDSFAKLKECSGVKQLIPNLSLEVVEYLKQISFLQDLPNKDKYSIFNYLNPNSQIKKISLPLSYKVAINNFIKQKSLIQLKEFEEKQPKKEVKKQIEKSPDITEKVNDKKSEISDFEVNFPDMIQQQQQQPLQQQAQDDPFKSLCFSEVGYQSNVDFFANFNFDQNNNKPQHQQQQQQEQQQMVQGQQSVFMIFNLEQQQNWQQLNQQKTYQPLQQQSQQPQLPSNQQQQLPPNQQPFEDIQSNIIFQINKNQSPNQNQNQNQNKKVNQEQNVKSEIFPLIKFDDDEDEITQQQHLLPQNKNDNNIDLLDIFDQQQKSSVQQPVNLLQIQLSPPQNQFNLNIPPHFLIPNEKLQFSSQIGFGSSSVVYKAIYNGKDVAVKKFKEINKEFEREIETLIGLPPHPNLLGLIGISLLVDSFCIITDFCSQGTLFELLHKKKFASIDWSMRIRLAIDIAEENHSQGFKITQVFILLFLNTTQSILLDGNMNIRIADFGLSKPQIDSNQLMTAVVGTYIQQHWMAPEVFEGQNYTFKADVFSFGIVLYELCSREIPYTQLQNSLQIMRFVTQNKGRPNLDLLNQGCPISMKNIMVKCWDQDPKQRPSFNELLSMLKSD